jgi:LCP family protein required for cell wall assembly
MVLFFRNSNTLHSASLKKIDSLINEIGTLKDENIQLNQSLDQQKDSNQLNEQTLRQLYLNVSTSKSSTEDLQKNLNNYKTFLEDERRKLATQNNELNTQITKQTQQINELKLNKENTKVFNDINAKTFSVLFLGENQKLTDTILLAVVNPEKQKTSLISIPRDLYYEGRKINEYYKFYGIEKTIKVIQKISGIKADKYIRFNFDSFTDLIDSIEGIDISIDQKLIDNSYPNGNLGYKTVVFNPGLEKMNGQRALEYARSRKSTSDFDRSLRQQKIIIAIKEKLNSLGIMKNIEFYITAFQSIQKNLDTNFNILEAIQNFDQYKDYQLSAGNILSNENFLYSAKSVSGQSILLPQKNTFLPFQQKLIEII